MTVSFQDPARLLFLDRLTQLYNWWFMAQYLRERFQWLASEKIPLSVLLVDLDNFKAINETHGRLAGDVVLRQVALLLQEGRRKGGYAVRYAGDEFFVFIEGANRDRAMTVAEEIRARIARVPIVVPHASGGIPVSASLGVATFPDETQTASGLIEKARRALAHAKRLGKNCASQDTGDSLPTEKEALAKLSRPRLLGREKELDLCRSLFETAASGRSRFVLVEGEHGLGKSRVLAELPGLATSTGVGFLQGGCLAQNQAVPYSALGPVLQEYFDRSPELVEPTAARLSGAKLAAVGSVLPFLTPTKDAAEAIPAPQRRRQLFHGMVDLLCLISEANPLAIFLEHLDWADEASLEVFLHLLSREDGRVIVCATAVGDLPERHDPRTKVRALPALLPSFEASSQFHRLMLSRLTLAQVGDLAADILRHPASPFRFQQQLFEVSRGVPLLVEETLKGLITRGVLRQEEGAWNFEHVTPEDFPASADEAIARRLENLDPETLEVVSEASIIGPTVDLPVLVEVLGQDPGETLHLVDRGRLSGVFEQSDPALDPGEIRFANERLREIVYEGVDPIHRRQTHRTVAHVYEGLARAGGQEALGPIAYHFERSDDSGKAGLYREKLRALREWLFSTADVGEPGAGEGGSGSGGGTGTGAGGASTGSGGGGEAGTVKVRILEASQPLDEGSLPLALAFIKTMALALKNMRVFPEGSQLVREEVAGATSMLLRLFEQRDRITLAEHRGALLANGQPVEGKALAALAQDLLRFFREHGVRSVTFVGGAVESEMRELLRILSGPRQGIPPEVGAWEELLHSRGILHVGVLPAIYVASTRHGTGRAEEETLLGDEATRLAAEVFRSLAGAVDNLRLYPPANELNVAIQEKLERQAQRLLERLPSVTLALADDTIVINGVRPNPKWFGLTIPLLYKLMQEHAVTSLTLARGLTHADLQVLLTQLAQQPPEDPTSPVVLSKVLQEHGVTTIQVGSRSYAAARGSLTGGGRPGQAGAGAGSATASPEAPREEDRLFAQVAQWLETPSAARDLREEEIPAALASCFGSDRKDLARLLWERIMAGLVDPEEGTRQRAAAGLNLLLTGANFGTQPWLVELSLEPLERALVKETSQRPFQWEVRAATEAVTLYLSHDDLSRVLALADALGRGQLRKPEQKRLLPVATAAVETMAEAGVFQPLWAALQGSEPNRREQSRAILAALGEGTTQFLATIVAQEEDAEVRKIAAGLLRPLPGAGLKSLLPQLYPPTPGPVSRRIVSVLDVLAPELGPDFVSLLGHPDVLVRAEFAATVSRLPKASAIRFLERALGEQDPRVLAGALECIRGVQAPEFLEVVVRLLRRGSTVEVLKAACLCLGQLKDQRAVAPLVEILQRRPRFWGLVKGLPETVRAAAARSLGELAVPEAKGPLRTALADSSMTVRSTARIALSRLRQGQVPR